MLAKGTGSRCFLVEHVKDNYYPRFYNPSYNRYRVTHFPILLEVNFCQSQWRVKCRSRVRVKVRA